MEYRITFPLDVLYLRGNRLFGEPGEHAEAQMPPWPSLVAGALRSLVLVDRGVDLHRFARGEVEDPDVMRVLGTPEAPGSFRIALVAVGRRTNGAAEVFVPPPSDLAVTESGGRPQAEYIEPVDARRLSGLRFSSPLSHLAVLRSSKLSKPTSRYWLSGRGLEAYLEGGPIEPTWLVDRSDLWKSDSRLGIALENDTRTVQTGRLYTSDAVAFKPGVGLIAAVAGADAVLPLRGLLRLGGDGRGATLEPANVARPSPWQRTPARDRFRMILSTPGLFPNGWSPLPAAGREEPMLRFRGLEARLIAAAVPRAQIVSGWDIARGRPKPAQRLVPAGAVYWLERAGGDLSVLQELVEDGLWPLLRESGQLPARDTAARDEEWRQYEQRRPEGYNNVWFGDWGRD